jgi:hypothetical protein
MMLGMIVIGAVGTFCIGWHCGEMHYFNADVKNSIDGSKLIRL